LAIGVALSSKSGNATQFIGLSLALGTALGALVELLNGRK
jgi:hypothetical protein